MCVCNCEMEVAFKHFSVCQAKLVYNEKKLVLLLIFTMVAKLVEGNCED